MSHICSCFGPTLLLTALFWANITSVYAQDLTPPAGGKPLILRDDSKSFQVGKGTGGEATVVAVQGQNFNSAIHATVEKRGDPWDLESRVIPSGKFAKGEAVLVRLWARMLQSRDESGMALLQLSLGENSPPWRAQFGRTLSVGKEWQEFFVRGLVQDDYEAGQLALKLDFGQAVQTLEVGGIEILSYGTNAPLTQLPETRTSYAGREANAPWRIEAETRIRELRMAPLAVQVIDRTGKPIPNAQVQIELKKHAFFFGCALNPSVLLSDDKPENAAYRRRFLEIFNSGSFVNSLKWEAWTGDWGPDLNRETTLKGLQWLQQHDMTIRGHVLVWPSFHNMVGYMKALQGKATPDELQRLVLSHIDEITSGTSPYISEWDVINEPRDNHDLMDIIGKQVMLDYFKRARNRLPNTRLVLNDYAILTTLADGNTQQQYEDCARYLIDNGAPIDGFGFQGHFGATVPSPMRILKVLDRFAALKRSIRVTEFTIEGDDSALQGDFTRDLLTLLFSHPSVVGFQQWGLENSVNKDGTLTPIGEAIRSLVNEKWHTNIKTTTDVNGSVTNRGFLGRYDVTVTQGNRTLTVPFELRSNSDQLLVTLP
ncbi:anti-sigma-I factor RsgI6 [Abditibacteriota bacterium]|nr:anti-sigma-I factor RsgI6 [Abditibacteriota bacterium]